MDNEYRVQTHVHEYTGSTLLAAEEGCLRFLHSHRFAGVTGEAIPTEHSHVHFLETNTDFFVDHYHTMKVKTDEAIPIYVDGNEIGHIHGFFGITSFDDQHAHGFRGNTLIENPTGPFDRLTPPEEE